MTYKGAAASPASPWTDERTELLRKLWSGKLSASQIAAELGRRFGIPFTRNAVIGRVHRLKLEKRGKLPAQVRKRSPRPRIVETASAEAQECIAGRSRFNPSFSFKKRISKALTKPERASAMETYNPKPVHIVDRRMFKQCAWPLWSDRGQPAYSELMCCGAQVAPGGCSYCEYHRQVSANGYPQQKAAA